MTTPRSDGAPRLRPDAVERLAFRLWRETVVHLSDAQARQTWEWLPPATRAPFVRRAGDFVAVVAEP